VCTGRAFRTCLQSRGTPPEYPYFCAKNKSEHDVYRDMKSARRSFAAKNRGVLERGKIVDRFLDPETSSG